MTARQSGKEHVGLLWVVSLDPTSAYGVPCDVSGEARCMNLSLRCAVVCSPCVYSKFLIYPYMLVSFPTCKLEKRSNCVSASQCKINRHHTETALTDTQATPHIRLYTVSRRIHTLFGHTIYITRLHNGSVSHIHGIVVVVRFTLSFRIVMLLPRRR